MTGKDWRNGVVAFVLCSTPEELVPEWEGDQLHYVDHLPDNMLVTRVEFTLTDEEIVDEFRILMGILRNGTHFIEGVFAGVRFAEKHHGISPRCENS
jgi:hypothetical protein